MCNGLGTVIHDRDVPAALQFCASFFSSCAQEMYTELADLRWQSGLRVISAGKMLITNRLHATVIGALLGIPTFYYDSLAIEGYGKVGGAMHMARESSEACTEMALRSWHMTLGSEADKVEAAMTRAAKYFRHRSGVTRL